MGSDSNGGGSGGGGGGETPRGVSGASTFTICSVLAFFDRDAVSTFSTRPVSFDVVRCVADVSPSTPPRDRALIFGDGYPRVDAAAATRVTSPLPCGLASSRRGLGLGAALCFCVCVSRSARFVVVRAGASHRSHRSVGLRVGAMNSPQRAGFDFLRGMV